MLNQFSAKERNRYIQQLKTETFDVLVIGGGITGAGIALDATARGLKVALTEMQDFASGTSGRSTRLIHGGLRYLKQGDFKLVSEVAKERTIIQNIAPHLVKPEPLLLPITRDGSFGKLTARLGMWFYELLAGIKKEERHRFLTATETLKLEPLLKKEGLLGSILYYEYRTDDARLTLGIIKEAFKRGALTLSYLKVIGFIYDNGKIKGVKVEDQMDHSSFNVFANYVVKASGPWVDELDHLDNNKQGNKLQLTKGVHLVFDHKKLPLKQSVYFDTFDKRMIFAIPHRGKTYVGTTDNFFNGDKSNPGITLEYKTYLLKNINDFFSGATLQLNDIESCWAGIRPLIKKAGKNPSEISRKDETFVWDSGLISIAGGKLTGYRKMAERVVDLISKKINSTSHKKLLACSTDKIVLSETTMANDKVSENSESELPERLYLQLMNAIENEMCLTPADFFIRRTGMMYFDVEGVIRFREQVIKLMNETLNWNEAVTDLQIKNLQKQLAVTGKFH